jgi:hypothetical protein
MCVSLTNCSVVFTTALKKSSFLQVTVVVHVVVVVDAVAVAVVSPHLSTDMLKRLNGKKALETRIWSSHRPNLRPTTRQHLRQQQQQQQQPLPKELDQHLAVVVADLRKMPVCNNNSSNINS